MPSFLTESQLETFKRDGYLIIDNFVKLEQARALKQHADEILQSMIQSIEHSINQPNDQSNGQSMKHPLTVFKTSDNQKQSSDFKQAESIHDHPVQPSTTQSNDQLPENSPDDRYFLNSADSIGFFFEPGAITKAVDPSTNQPIVQFTVPKHQSINKVGHFLHVLDPVFSRFTNNLTMEMINQSISSQIKQSESTSSQSIIKQIACDLRFFDPIVLQSMLICKQPKLGGKVDKHRDSTFLRTQPINQPINQTNNQSSAIGFWIPLEDCDAENGCLSFVKGSHLNHGSTRWFGRMGHTERSINNVPQKERSEINTSRLTGPDNVHCKTGFRGTDPAIDLYKEDEWILAPVKAGSLVLIHGDVAHMSQLNESSRSRYAYTFHVIEDRDTLYPEDNWLQSNKPFPHLN